MTADWLMWDAVRAEADYRVEEMRKAASLARAVPSRRSMRNKANTLITRSRRTRRGEAARSAEEPHQRGGGQEEGRHQHPHPHRAL